MIALEDVRQARVQIAPYVKRTTLERNATLSRELGANVYLKLELFQKTGSFKPRGAFNQILQLTPDQRKHGVVGVSGGNFAQGLAYAARELDTPALVMHAGVDAQELHRSDTGLRGYGRPGANHLPGLCERQTNTRRQGGISCTRSTALTRWPARARSGWSCWRICRS